MRISPARLSGLSISHLHGGLLRQTVFQFVIHNSQRRIMIMRRFVCSTSIMASSIGTILKRFPGRLDLMPAEDLGSAGGFSGARFWRIRAEGQTYGLRRWPREHPDPRRLEYIHSVLRHVAENGFDKIPLPVLCQDGRSSVVEDGHSWELTPWLPGRADFCEQPSDTRLRACMQALARFHLAAATHPSARPAGRPSPGIQKRRDQLQDLCSGRLKLVAGSVKRGDWPELPARANKLLTLFPRCAPSLTEKLREASTLSVPLQPVIRDIWHDHVLFVGDEVSGIVDFGAMRVESVAGDIARLLGSLIADDEIRRQAGLGYYTDIRRLSREEAALVEVFDKSGVLLSGLNWLDWIYVQGRQFEDRERILIRLDQAICRLELLAAAGFQAT